MWSGRVDLCGRPSWLSVRIVAYVMAFFVAVRPHCCSSLEARDVDDATKDAHKGPAPHPHHPRPYECLPLSSVSIYSEYDHTSFPVLFGSVHQIYLFILFLYVEVESSMATRTRKRKVGTRFIASAPTTSAPTTSAPTTSAPTTPAPTTS